MPEKETQSIDKTQQAAVALGSTASEDMRPAQGEVINVEISQNTPGIAIVHVKPGDTVNLKDINFKEARVDIVGSDVVILDGKSGSRVVMPEAGLYLFSPKDSPHFFFGSEAIDSNGLLAKVGAIANISSKDYVTYTHMEFDKNQQNRFELNKAYEAQASAKISAAVAGVQLSLATQKAQAGQIADYTEQPTADGDPLLTARQALLYDSQGRFQTTLPVDDATSGASSPRHKPETTNTTGTLTKSFLVNAELLQVGPSIDTSSANTVYNGGNGSELASLSASNAFQYSTQTIDASADTTNTTIYANNPAYFSTTQMSRVIQLTPLLPDGFTVQKIKINGLPIGFSIFNGTADSANNYTIATPTLAGGNLDLIVQYGNAAAKTFVISITVTVDFTDPAHFSVPTTTEYTYAINKTVSVQMVNGVADYTFTDSTGNAGWVFPLNPNNNSILTGDGNVTVYGGEGQNNIVAGNGNDTIHGGSSNDTITTGTGNSLIYASKGSDLITAGSGNNTMNYSGVNGDLTLDLSSVNGSGQSIATKGTLGTDTLSGINNIIATNGNNVLSGNSNNNYIQGGTGSDTIYASLGADTLDGGAGSNTLNFSSATTSSVIDLVAGTSTGYGTDLLSNFSTVIASSYGDTITGTAGGNDIITTGAGNDLVHGAGGSNRIVASLGSDTLDGGTGNNTLDFSQAIASSLIDLNAGTTSGYATDVISNFNTVIASSHGDTIMGTAGNDTIISGAGSDLIHGDSGNNYIYASTGSDTLDGGAGSNTIDFSNATAASAIDLSSHTSIGFASDILSNFSHVIGSSHGDTLTGSGGNDTIIGGNGSNLFYATTGTDSLVGGSGNDTISFSNATSSSVIDLSNHTVTGFENGALINFSNVIGSSHGDTITGTLGSDHITGGAIAGYFHATTGSDSYIGGGLDTLDYSSVGGSISASFSGLSGTINKTIDSSTDTVSGVTSITGGSGNNSYSLDSSSLASFSSINGGTGGTNTATLHDTASADTTVNTQLSHVFSNISQIDLSGMVNANDAWGSTVTGSEIHSLLGAYGGTLDLIVKGGSNLAATLNGFFADDSTFTSHVTNGTTTTWIDASAHQVSIHVTTI